MHVFAFTPGSFMDNLHKLAGCLGNTSLNANESDPWVKRELRFMHDLPLQLERIALYHPNRRLIFTRFIAVARLRPRTAVAG